MYVWGLLAALVEDLDGVGGELAEGDFVVLVVKLDAAGVGAERLKEGDRARVVHLDERLDGGADRLAVLVLEEATEELYAARLADFAKDIREFREGRVTDGQAIEGALDAEGDLFEAVKGDRFEGFPGGEARFRVLGAEEIDQQTLASWLG